MFKHSYNAWSLTISGFKQETCTTRVLSRSLQKQNSFQRNYKIWFHDLESMLFDLNQGYRWTNHFHFICYKGATFEYPTTKIDMSRRYNRTDKSSNNFRNTTPAYSDYSFKLTYNLDCNRWDRSENEAADRAKTMELERELKAPYPRDPKGNYPFLVLLV